MDTTTREGPPLHQRMLEGMRMRKLEPRTQEGYIRAVGKLTVNAQAIARHGHEEQRRRRMVGKLTHKSR